MNFSVFEVTHLNGNRRWLVVEQCRAFEGDSREDALDHLGWVIMQEEVDKWNSATSSSPTVATSGPSSPVPAVEPWTWTTASAPK